MKNLRRLCRSVLFSPADRLNVLEKAAALPTLDCVVIDLEDSVRPEKKAEARANVSQLLRTLSSKQSERRPLITLRINCPKTTPFAGVDVKLLREFSFDAVIIPKVDSLETLRLSVDLIQEQQEQSARKIPVWAMIESAKGVRNVYAIAESADVEGLVFGQNDLSKDLRLPSSSCIRSRDALRYSMQKCVVAARAAEKLVIDGVFMDVRDLAGLREDAEFGWGLGFDGKSLIHPNQVSVVNEVYTPSEESLQEAKRLIDAFELALSQGKSVATLDGKLIEYLHVKRAKELLAMAAALRQ